MRGAPEVRVPANPYVRLARVLHLELEAPAEAILLLDGAPVARFPAAAVHDLPLLGLRAGEVHEATVLLGCDGTVDWVGPIAFDPGPGPPGWPEVEVLADDPDRRSPGATLIDLWSAFDGVGLAAFDADGVPVWSLALEERPLAATLEPDGTLWIASRGLVRQVDLLGNELGRWRPAADAGPGDVPVDVTDFHHDVRPVPGGFLALDFGEALVDEYPVSDRDPTGATAPADLVDATVVEVARDGTVLRRFPLSERLDTRRIGWGSLDETSAGLDWAHANALQVDPTDGGILVSVRHQDAVVKLHRETGDVAWILSVPDGWRPPQDALRLAAEPGLTWPYHPHAPRITADGHLLLFDNGNADRTTPYAGVDDGRDYVSRMVEYRIDEAAGTVAEVWSHHATTTGPLYSEAYGDADLLANGDRLGLWGYLSAEGGVQNLARGWGARSIRIVEAAPDGAVVWEVSIHEDLRERPVGWQAHGLQRVESWYPANLP